VNSHVLGRANEAEYVTDDKAGGNQSSSDQSQVGTVKQVKDQLSSLSPRGEGSPGGDLLKKGGDSLKDMKPKF
jgi:hypothetical protein